MPARAKDWCFTAFQEDFPYYGCGQKCSYIVWQHETCPDTGRQHFQGYAEFKEAVTIKTAQRRLRIPGAHMEKRKGSPSQAAAYCMKDETRNPGCDYIEEGTRRPDPKPGARTDILALRDAIQNGKRGLELLEDALVVTFAKYPRFTNTVSELIMQQKGKEFRQLKTTLLIGSGGMSKTKRALYSPNENGVWLRKPDSYRVPRSDNLKWFPHYQGESIVVFDDFYGSSCTFDRFLDLMDGHECPVENKGGYGYALWTEVWITSNRHPDNWWKDHSYTEDEEFNRRIHEIINVDEE